MLKTSVLDVWVFSLENKSESTEVVQNQMGTNVRGRFLQAFVRDLEFSPAGVHTDLTFHMITEHKPPYALLQDFLYLPSLTSLTLSLSL